MKKKKLLSILIPTYNREKYLVKNLNSLLLSIDDEILSEVEIIISDNNSSDNTLEELEKIKNRYPFINYSTNKTNIGADGNFLKLIKESNGEYCWLLGDDEFLLNGALKKIIKYLKENTGIGLYHIKNSKNEKICIYENKVKYMKKVNFWISFISANIFKKEAVEELDYDSYLGSCLIQEIFYFQAIEKNLKNALIKDRIFSTDRACNNGGYGYFQVFAINQNKIFDYFEKRGMDKKIRDNTNRLMCVDFFANGILEFRLNEHKNKYLDEEVEKILRETLSKYKEYQYICRPLLELSIEKAKKFHKKIKKVKKIYKLIFGY